MLGLLLQEQRAALDHFFDQLDLSEVEAVLERLINCRGTIFFTGVGKSGLVGEKLATTFASTGIRSWFLPPTNALHGDLGIVSKEDICICLSKSGQTDELLALLPHARHKGAQLISWVSRRESRLAQLSDLVLHLPLQKELCPFNLAPTTSDALQLLVGNLLCVACMKKRDLPLSEYAANHPAGQIGRRASLRVSDLMIEGEELPIVSPDSLLVEELVTLSNKRCGTLLVCEKEKMCGIFTDGDLRRALQAQGANLLQRPLKELMIFPFRSVAPTLHAYEALAMMEANPKKPITVLPVLDKERLVGLLRLHDVLQAGL